MKRPMGNGLMLQDVVQASEMVKRNKMMKAKIFHVEWKLSETMRGHGATSPVSLNSGPIQIRSRHLTHDMSYSSCLSHSLPIQSSCISHLRLYIPPSPSSHSPPSLNQWKQWSQKVMVLKESEHPWWKSEAVGLDRKETGFLTYKIYLKNNC